MVELSYTYTFTSFNAKEALIVIDIADGHSMQNITSILKRIKHNHKSLPDLIFINHCNGTAWTQAHLDQQQQFSHFTPPLNEYAQFFI